MRTTLTLDDDVAALLGRILKSRNIGFKQLVNDALRAGLQAMRNTPRRQRRTYTHPVDLGPCLVGGIDDIAEVLAVGEGEDYK